jgi:hypothetical protein
MRPQEQADLLAFVTAIARLITVINRLVKEPLQSQ